MVRLEAMFWEILNTHKISSTLLYTVGPKSEHIFIPFNLTEEAKDYLLMVDKFDRHFKPERNVIHERAMFHPRSQRW